MFAEAKAIVGPHGAGFANAVFCQPGSVLIEFMRRVYSNVGCFEKLARFTGIEYHSIVGTEDAVPKSQISNNDHTVDRIALSAKATSDEFYVTQVCGFAELLGMSYLARCTRERSARWIARPHAAFTWIIAININLCLLYRTEVLSDYMTQPLSPGVKTAQYRIFLIG